MASLSKNSKNILGLIAQIAGRGAGEFGWLVGELIEIGLDPYGKASRGTRPKHVYGSLYSLKRGNYIETATRKRKKFIRVTDKGRLIVLQDMVCEKIKNSVWDKKWRMVIFDVPENNRKERDFLRSYLKSFGFKELQKSVWVFPYDIEREFQQFLKLCNKNIEGDLRFITTEKISNDGDLKRFFKLASRNKVVNS